MRSKELKILALLSLFMLSSCAQSGLRIGNHVTLCCPGNYQDYGEYRIEVVDIPIFLRGYVVDEFETAMSEIGLMRTESASDLVVTLRYEHVNLNYEQEEIDPFLRSGSMGEELHYIAIINITMREVVGNTAVWSGNISRIHVVTPGEYMHEEGAKIAFLDTFRDLLTRYPSE